MNHLISSLLSIVFPKLQIFSKVSNVLFNKAWNAIPFNVVVNKVLLMFF